jgi:hypothetical protein
MTAFWVAGYLFCLAGIAMFFYDLHLEQKEAETPERGESE